jgi:hypothetical protein
MAASTSPSFQNVGFVAKPGEDIFPTTGPHLDVRVLKDGQYIDPGTIRSLLTRLKVGKERKSLWQQQGEQWMPSYTITSGYGKRAAPTKGASTYHLGQDYGIPGGTELAWEGPGSFTPGRGYGSIKTTDAQGTPYEIRLLHTIGGKEFNQQAAQQAQQVAQQETKPGDTYIFMQTPSAQATASNDFLSLYVDELMKNRESAKIQSMINPTQMLMSAFNQTPNYLA